MPHWRADQSPTRKLRRRRSSLRSRNRGESARSEFGHELHLAVTLQPSNRLAHCLLCRDIATICVGSFVPVLAEHLARLLSQFLEDCIVDEDISEPTHPVERCVEDRLQAHRAFPLTVCRSEKRGKIDAEYCPELGI